MFDITISYLAMLGISLLFWFFGHELAIGKSSQKRRSRLRKLIDTIVGNPLHDYMMKLYGSVLVALVIACAIGGLTREQMGAYWRVVAFYGFVLVVAPLLVIVCTIEFFTRNRQK
jgi:hypothetical protein